MFLLRLVAIVFANSREGACMSTLRDLKKGPHPRKKNKPDDLLPKNS